MVNLKPKVGTCTIHSSSVNASKLSIFKDCSRKNRRYLFLICVSRFECLVRHTSRNSQASIAPGWPKSPTNPPIRRVCRTLHAGHPADLGCTGRTGDGPSRTGFKKKAGVRRSFPVRDQPEHSIRAPLSPRGLLLLVIPQCLTF